MNSGREMPMNEKDLLKLKEDIDKAKTDVAELRGKQDHLMGELRNYNCNSVEEGTKQLQQIEKDIRNLDGQIQKGIDEIKEKYGV